MNEKEPKRVTGIGGLFFKCQNPEEIRNWYANHLGLDTNNYGATFWWKDENGNECSTQCGVVTFEWTKYLRPYAVTLKNGKTKKSLQFRIQA